MKKLMINKIKLFCIFSFCFFLISLFVQMYVANKASLKGRLYSELTIQKQILQKEIALLEFEDSNLSCLSNIELKAREYGFVDMNESLAAINNPSLAAYINSQ